MRYTQASASIFGAIQTAVGSPATIAGTDVLAALDLSSSPDIQTEEHKFAGPSSREVETSITDKIRTAEFSVFMPAAGAAGTTSTLFTWFEAFGMSEVISAGVSAESTNTPPSDEVLTLEYRKHPVTGNDKIVTISDARGQVDFEAEIGHRAMFKLAIRGEYQEAADGAGLTHDFGTQKTLIAQRVLTDNIVKAKLQPIGGAAQADKNICFGKLNITNMGGYDLARYQDSCETSHGLLPVPGELKLIVTEDEAGAIYNPETFLNEHHSFELEWGTVAGSIQNVTISDAQLVTITDTELGPWAAQELTFKIVGSTSVKIS